LPAVAQMTSSPPPRWCSGRRSRRWTARSGVTTLLESARPLLLTCDGDRPPPCRRRRLWRRTLPPLQKPFELCDAPIALFSCGPREQQPIEREGVVASPIGAFAELEPADPWEPPFRLQNPHVCAQAAVRVVDKEVEDSLFAFQVTNAGLYPHDVNILLTVGRPSVAKPSSVHPIWNGLSPCRADRHGHGMVQVHILRKLFELRSFGTLTASSANETRQPCPLEP
jgi:hypothetical protein